MPASIADAAQATKLHLAKRIFLIELGIALRLLPEP
jgi:hypothetical protein